MQPGTMPEEKNYEEPSTMTAGFSDRSYRFKRFCRRRFKIHGFARLLFRWKASVYKLLWREMLVFLLFYGLVSILYRSALRGITKSNFEQLAFYAYDYTKVFPISFVLGFYVTVVFDRWWTQFKAIPWPDRVVYNVAAHVLGNDEEARIIRRTLVRYVNLSAIMIFRAGSKRVKKRFPTLSHIVEAGILTEEEKNILKDLPSTHPKYWVPCVWFVNLIRMTRKQGRIVSDPAMKTIVDELNNFRDKCDELYGFDWIIVPLVYTQVVTIATYSYFVACLLGRQYLDPNEKFEGHTIDLYFPGFTLLEFVFYVGWLKVAENLMNPFGEDDDDFDMNFIVDRNLQISFLTVDDLYEISLPIVRDRHFDITVPDIPYTNAAVKNKGKPWQGSASKVRLSRRDMAFTCMPHKVFTEEDEVMTCKLHTNSLKKNNDGHPDVSSERNSSPNDDDGGRETGSNNFSNFKRPPPAYSSFMPSNLQTGPRPPEELAVPPKKLSRSTGERRKDLTHQAQAKRDRAESAAAATEEPSSNSRSRQEERGTRDCSSEEDDECSPLSNSSYPVDLNQMVNESVI
ncbi:bestrophin-2-like isoform X2 [Acanthaster planci]|uniref:Bestrophin homolog n=1 Tax=Acanthaster planci TaxID=133434 RepID=A0A8B7YBG7_ACAPL|nr:bestrophin-2-like isoform X2 [Acanthaster planci]